jgi:hypothetical protein
MQGMKTRMFHDLETKGKNWHKELPSVLLALRTNINRATRDTTFHLVYRVDAVLPLEIFFNQLGWPSSARKIRVKQENSIAIFWKKSVIKH